MCECVYVCVSECVCEREDGRCKRVHGFHTFEETFFTHQLCAIILSKRG